MIRIIFTAWKSSFHKNERSSASNTVCSNKTSQNPSLSARLHLMLITHHRFARCSPGSYVLHVKSRSQQVLTSRKGKRQTWLCSSSAGCVTRQQFDKKFITTPYKNVRRLTNSWPEKSGCCPTHSLCLDFFIFQTPVQLLRWSLVLHSVWCAYIMPTFPSCLFLCGVVVQYFVSDFETFFLIIGLKRLLLSPRKWPVFLCSCIKRGLWAVLHVSLEESSLTVLSPRPLVL